MRANPKRAFLRRMLTLGVVATSSLSGVNALAQSTTFPTRPVKLMIASAPGGATDVVTRIIAEKLSAEWGQPVIVEQKVGANGMIASAALTKAAPDGHVAYVSVSSIVQNVLLRPDPGYRLEDIQPVTMLATIPIALATGTSSNIKSIEELIAAAKAQPDRVSYGTLGAGSGSHIVVSAMASDAGVRMTHVPYKGETSSFPDLVSGQLTVGLGSAGFYANQAAAGKVRLLAVTSPKRLPRIPDVPTLAEAGYPGANLPGWFGVFLPGGTPKPVVERFAQGVRKALAAPDVQNKILEFGFLPAGESTGEFARYIDEQRGIWSTVIKKNNIRID